MTMCGRPAPASPPRSGGPRSPVRSGLIKSTVSTVSLTEITHTSFPQPVCARNYRVLNVAPAQGPIRYPYRLPLEIVRSAINLGGLTSSPDHRLRPRPIHVASLHRSSPSLHARSRIRLSMGADSGGHPALPGRSPSPGKPGLTSSCRRRAAERTGS